MPWMATVRIALVANSGSCIARPPEWPARFSAHRQRESAPHGHAARERWRRRGAEGAAEQRLHHGDVWLGLDRGVQQLLHEQTVVERERHRRHGLWIELRRDLATLLRRGDERSEDLAQAGEAAPADRANLRVAARFSDQFEVQRPFVALLKLTARPEVHGDYLVGEAAEVAPLRGGSNEFGVAAQVLVAEGGDQFELACEVAVDG